MGGASSSSSLVSSSFWSCASVVYVVCSCVVGWVIVVVLVEVVGRAGGLSLLKIDGQNNHLLTYTFLFRIIFQITSTNSIGFHVVNY